MASPNQLGQRCSRRRWITFSAASCGISLLSGANRSQAQDVGEPVGEAAATMVSRLSFSAPQTQVWRTGLILTTPVECRNVIATYPIPQDWPEQTVTLIGKNIDPLVSGWEIREIVGGAKQVALQMPVVPANSTVEMTMQFQIERTRIELSGSTDDLVIPKRGERRLRPYLGNSPYIDASNARIKKVSRDLAAEEIEGDWRRVERIYDWVRENVKYVEGDLENASVALKNGKGDCEEMTSLFVALCRNAQVPARMVWIPGHCYPEFCLQDSDRNDHWFPCQAAGTRQFGRMDEYRPILQKGDRFKVEESKTPVRYVSEYFKCDRKGKGKPAPKFIREQVEQQG